MKIETERLTISEFTMEMAQAVHVNSLDDDNRRFVPDEVFETLEEACETVAFLMEAYHSETGPFVYPVLRKSDGANIGYVQVSAVEDGMEIGYHIAGAYTGHGYATEALRAFLPVIMTQLGLNSVWGVVLEENAASCRVLEKCGFQLFFQGEALYQGRMRCVRRYEYHP